SGDDGRTVRKMPRPVCRDMQRRARLSVLFYSRRDQVWMLAHQLLERGKVAVSDRPAQRQCKGIIVAQSQHRTHRQRKSGVMVWRFARRNQNAIEWAGLIVRRS